MTSLALITNLLRGDGLIVILLIALLFGAKRLPDLAKGIGQSIREFSKGKNGEDEAETKQLPPKT